MPDRLDRADYVRAVMAAAGEGSFEPIHVQKLFFLLDERVASRIGGKYFDFQPYDYGPFDSSVYDVLEGLRAAGEAQIDLDWRGMRVYGLTKEGAQEGSEDLAALPTAVQGDITKYAKWVRSQTFASLVSAVYKAYPTMKVNSIFVDPAERPT